MADAPHDAAEFVADFDDEVGLLPRDLAGIALQTKKWPEFMEYSEPEQHILYEFEIPVEGKAYLKIGWYLWVYPSSAESGHPGSDTSISCGIQFFDVREKSHTYSDWNYLVWEYEQSKSSSLPLWKPEPEHVKRIVDSLRDFIYNRLKPVLKRPSLKVHVSWMPEDAPKLTESSAEDFVGGFDDEVGVVPRDLASIERRVRDWPEFSNYDPGQMILFEEATVIGDSKAYTRYGWYLALKPTADSRVYEAEGSLQFFVSDEWFNESDYREIIMKSHSYKGSEAFTEPSPTHVHLAKSAMKNFINHRLVPELSPYIKINVITESMALAEHIVDVLLENLDSLEAADASRHFPQQWQHMDQIPKPPHYHNGYNSASRARNSNRRRASFGYTDRYSLRDRGWPLVNRGYERRMKKFKRDAAQYGDVESGTGI